MQQKIKALSEMESSGVHKQNFFKFSDVLSYGRSEEELKSLLMRVKEETEELA